MTELWHCTPSQYEEQTEDMIALHIGIWTDDRNARKKEQQRRDQELKLLSQ